MPQIIFSQDRGIYGRVESPAWVRADDDPFAVFKDADGRWTIGQRRTGKVITAMLPARLKRTKAKLLRFLEDLKRDEPDSYALVGLIDGEWPEELKEDGRRLIDWARDYVEPVA